MGTSDKRHGSNSNQALHPTAVHSIHIYEIRPRKNHQGVNLISDALPFGRLWYGEPNAASNAIDYAKFRSRLILVDHHTVDHAGFAGAVIIDINASARFD
jgi:hypothetical protein